MSGVIGTLEDTDGKPLVNVEVWEGDHPPFLRMWLGDRPSRIEPADAFGFGEAIITAAVMVDGDLGTALAGICTWCRERIEPGETKEAGMRMHARTCNQSPIALENAELRRIIASRDSEIAALRGALDLVRSTVGETVTDVLGDG